MSSKHSPLPWRIRHGRFIENDEYRLASIAVVSANAMDQDSIDRARVDAALIVKAVNNHQQLLEALQGLIDIKDYKDINGKDERYRRHQPEAWELARKALEQAEAS